MTFPQLDRDEMRVRNATPHPAVSASSSRNGLIGCQGLAALARQFSRFENRDVRLIAAFEYEQVARLTVQRFANRRQGGKADRLCLAGLEDGQVGERDPDLLGEVCQCHAPRIEQVIKLDGNFHGQTVASNSARISLPWRKICASTKIRRIASSATGDTSRSMLVTSFSGRR